MSNPDNKSELEANQASAQEEQKKPLFSGVDSEGKERLFNSVEEAQQSWQNSQDFIKNTVFEKKAAEKRIQELEAKLNQSTKLEDALQQLNNKEESPVTDTTPTATTETTPQVDVETIETIKAQITQEIMGSLTASQQAQVQEANQKESIEAAVNLYGDKYEDKLRERAKELNMSDDDIIREAQSSPQRFKVLFGLDNKQNKNYSPDGSVKVPSEGKEAISLKSGGFTARERLGSHLSNLEAFAKKRGLDVKFNT